jgi:predicted ester cyclase
VSPEEKKAKINRFVDEVINHNQWDRVDQYVAANAVDHVLPPGLPNNIEGTKTFFGMLRAAFPDFHYTFEDTMIDGDLVCQRVTGHGTMQNSFLGMPATNKNAAWPELHIVRVDKEGKIVEHWGDVDQMGMMTQLGLIPAQV